MNERLEIAEYLAELIHSQFENRKPAMIPQDININELLELSIANQIWGFTARALMRLENIQPQLYEHLKRGSSVMIYKSKLQEHEIKKIQEIFEEQGIKNMPLKGIFMKKYYPLPELREMGDIDLVVEENDLERAGKILKNMGYTLKQRISNHDVYIKKPYMVIELHKNMYKQEIDKKQHDYFESFVNAVLDDEKKYCYHQKTEDFYVYMIAHMAGHFYIRGCGVRNLIDIYVFRNKFKGQLDEEYIDRELKECGIYDFEKHMKKAAGIWLGNDKSDDFYDDLLTFMVMCGIYGKEEYGFWNEYSRTNSKNNKVNMTLWYIFPPYHYMKKYYEYLKKAPYLLAFAWLHRILRGLVFKRGKQRRDYLNEVPKQEVEAIQRIYKKMKFDFE